MVVVVLRNLDMAVLSVVAVMVAAIMGSLAVAALVASCQRW